MRALTVNELDDVGGGPWWNGPIAWWIKGEIVSIGIDYLVDYIWGNGAGAGDSGSVQTANGNIVDWSCDNVSGGMQMTLTSGGDSITVGC